MFCDPPHDLRYRLLRWRASQKRVPPSDPRDFCELQQACGVSCERGCKDSSDKRSPALGLEFHSTHGKQCLGLGIWGWFYLSE